MPEACYPTPWPEPKALWEPGLCGRLLGPGARAASAIRINSSSWLGLVGCCFFWGWEELNSYPVFSRIYSYSRAGAESEPSQPQCHSTTPGRMASEGSLGRSCPPPCWKGSKDQQVHFAQPVWEQGGVTVQAAGGGREKSLPLHPTPALGGTQAQALGKGPGNLSLKLLS